MSVTISKSAKTYPRLPYEDIKNAVLGKKYTLSLTFVGEKRAFELNRKHRQGNYVPNVLSFPLSDEIGEIYITPQVAKRESKKIGMDQKNFIGYLFIHGLLHLKGYPHGDTMEGAEKRYMKRFNLK
jgi:probable rRNA maturation factor